MTHIQVRVSVESQTSNGEKKKALTGIRKQLKPWASLLSFPTASEMQDVPETPLYGTPAKTTASPGPAPPVSGLAPCAAARREGLLKGSHVSGRKSNLQ